LLLAANRDERLDRPALPPGCHWPEHPDIFGGLDILAGGTWLALNRQGVVAAVLNRTGTLGPAPGNRSRGELPLLALQHTSAEQAADAFSLLNGGAWRSFNLIVADSSAAYFVRGLGEGPVQTRELSPGIHMVTAHDPDEISSPRIARNLPLFRAALPPDPPDWASWPALLSDGSEPAESALHIAPVSGFGTVSSALVALAPDRPPHFQMSEAPATTTSFRDVAWPAGWF
jgi:hypothetical protein